MSVQLESAFMWVCPVCGENNYAQATYVCDLGDDDAREIAQHFETLDAVEEGDGVMGTDYLVTRVVCGPAFVTCGKCSSTHAALLPDDRGEDE